MPEKVDYKKDYKEFYLPKTDPVILSIPSIQFAIIEGQGDPNGKGFATDTAALFSFSYAVRMSYKGKEVPHGYYEYTVFPLEGEWDLIDTSKSSSDKSNFRYRIMIRQPDFLTKELFQKFVAETSKKNPNPSLDRLMFEEMEEGLCCQMMHVGSYADEPRSFARMEQFCSQNGYKRMFKKHREIYLSDPRKTAAEKMKTVLRFRIKAESI